MSGAADYQDPVSEYPESGVNWEILKELAEKPHLLYDPFRLIKLLMDPHPDPVTIPGYTATVIVEALDDVLVSHHLLDLIGVPHGLSLDTRDLGARVLLAVRGHMALSERLDRIADWHQRETGPAGTVGDFCTECEHRWPCDTRRMADGRYADDDGTELREEDLRVEVVKRRQAGCTARIVHEPTGTSATGEGPSALQAKAAALESLRAAMAQEGSRP